MWPDAVIFFSALALARGGGFGEGDVRQDRRAAAPDKIQEGLNYLLAPPPPPHLTDFKDAQRRSLCSHRDLIYER